MDKIMAGMASGLAAVVVVLILMLLPLGFEETVPGVDNRGTSTLTKIVISKGIDVIDSGVTFNPPIARTIVGFNNTVTWINQNSTSIILRAPYEGYLFGNTTIVPGGNFSYTFERPGIYAAFEVNAGKSGIIIVSTPEIESSRLAVSSPSILQDDSKDMEVLARAVIKAAQPDDDIESTRLNNTRMVAYVTNSGGDIIVPRDLCILCSHSYYQPIHYTSALGDPIIYPSDGNLDRMKNFTAAVMQEIGYTMDGTEWIDAVNYGNRAEITISQKVNGGWILPIPGAQFSFMDNWTWIDLGRWYDNESISGFEFELGSDAAVDVAVKFMNNEVDTNPLLKPYKYELGQTREARVTIIEDKVMYLVPLGYRTTDPTYFDDRGHCGEPASGSFDVLVDAGSGIPFDWQYSRCA
jgi:hypothetical protein